MDREKVKIGIIGLGYVGLPLAVEFGRKFSTLGFDINEKRICELCAGEDRTREVERDVIQASRSLSFTTKIEDLISCNVYIITVPTPIDRNKLPDFTPLEKASEMVGSLLNIGDTVIYESTVYPGATEEKCIPVLEKQSTLIFNRDFVVGYSPERINPGDKIHRLVNIIKVTSGSTPESADFVDSLYQEIIEVGTHKAPSIRVAEASKVIENTQRDVNIALMNELAKMFSCMDIDTKDVLDAAGTKWNFLPFTPGLVGGHCIGVDPYYLAFKAQEVGYYPEMILAERRINDSMGKYIAEQVIHLMLKKRIHVVDSQILVMGLTFKENCPDLRNTRVVDIVAKLSSLGAHVDVYDPWVDKDKVEEECGLEVIENLLPGRYDSIIIAVGHKEFIAMGAEVIRGYGKPVSVVYDIKRILPKEAIDAGL